MSMNHHGTMIERPLPTWRGLLLALPLSVLASCGGSSEEQTPPIQAQGAIWDQFDWDEDNWS